MDKNAIKKYAVWARRELISRVSQRALLYGISEKDCGDMYADTINGHLLTSSEKKQRQSLIAKIKKDGYQQAMEAAAYTWFNRFCALRFMEVNGYLPSHVRVFTDEQNAFKPQILAEAIHLEIDGLDMEKVYELKDANKTDELYKYLLIVQCNALGNLLPGMFTRIEDYTELLFPDNLLRGGSVIEQMIALIPQEDWTDQVQIIGWLYQYYNAEPKDKVFENLKKNIKISKENIPAATQLFTPDWIVRYMVENSLGRIAVRADSCQPLAVSHKERELARIEREKEIAERFGWKYYLPEAEQEESVRAELSANSYQLTADQLLSLKVIDPCMGSGHILVYMFDVLVQIYEAYGYNTREAAGLILQNNLYGLDIDDRAAQLAYFAVMMKARQYDRRIFSRGIQPHVYAIVESNDIGRDVIDYFEDGRADLKKALETIITELHDAKEYGSILNVTQVGFTALYARLEEIKEDISLFANAAQTELRPLIEVAEVMAQKYHTVVTNPPYMGSSGMSAKLSEFVKKNYPDSKSDLFAVFIERCGIMCGKNGYQAMITQHAWMFLSSFEKLREKLLQRETVNMAHLGARAFEEIGGEVVQTTSFVMQQNHIDGYKSTYCRLIDPTTQQGKEDMFLAGENRYNAQQDNFSKIPGSPVTYWISNTLSQAFSNGKAIDSIGASRSGMQTGNNDLFLRLWFEIDNNNICFDATATCDLSNIKEKWFPQPKGGAFRKWYGNFEYLVNFQENGRDLRLFTGTSIIKNPQFYFRRGVCWSHTTSKSFSGRYMPSGCIFNVESPTFYPNDEDWLEYVLGFVNTKILDNLFGAISQTMHYMAGDMAKIPVIHDETKKAVISEYVKKNILLSRADWDSFETSWNFKRHPIVAISSQQLADSVKANSYQLIANSYHAWESESTDRFNQLKANEEELNSIFIDIYGLQDELTAEVEDKDVTVRKADLQRDIKSLISYAVGCMFGRYSLDVDGLAYAGGDWDASKYATFPADKDNIIPICDDEYFDDDIVARFVKFIETVCGKDTLEENLRFIADALGGKGASRDVIRSYFLNDFYADHLKIYQKRPIYWLFDSGKKGGFKALIYMHRYQPDTIARIRTDYVHEQQARYRTAIADLENRIASVSTSERVKLNKQLQKLQAQADEIHAYEEKIHHLADQMIRIDLDDGVKVNYAKFEDVLSKIK